MSITVDIDAKIPNNVDLAGDRRLQRALESWQPKFIRWWEELGPGRVQARTRCSCAPPSTSASRAGPTSVTSRCPTTAGASSWPNPKQNRKIAFGEHKGEDVWQEVPGEYRSDLRRLIVVQGDTEPASVEQQRQLSLTAPSLYDMRNLFQVNVEEGRHLWAMVYLLHRYFGRDGRDEADAMLERHSGDADNPRILGAFNEETPDWLSFFFFTYFTDRDGKYQLASMRESAFDPLSRTCDFMLKEEAHHMFVGATGVGPVRRAHARADAGARHRRRAPPRRHQPRRAPEVPELPLLGRRSTCSVPRPRRTPPTTSPPGSRVASRRKRRDDDHRLDDVYPLRAEATDAGIGQREVTQLAALNETLREDYTDDCQKGVDRWNRALAEAGSDFQLRLPHIGFHRQVGTFAGHNVSPDGQHAHR